MLQNESQQDTFYICAASAIRYNCQSLLYVKKTQLDKVLNADSDIAVDIHDGKGGPNCSKRGSVSLSFFLKDVKFTIINFQLKKSAYTKRLRDLANIFLAHREALADNSSVFVLAG
jgi:hypothetical protein